MHRIATPSSQVAFTLLGPTPTPSPSPTSQHHSTESHPLNPQTLRTDNQLYTNLHKVLRPAVRILKGYYQPDKSGGPPQPIESNSGPISVSYIVLEE
jgi:hypothetical protein